MREQGKLSPGAQIPHKSHRHGGTRERTQHTDTHKAHARSQTGVQSPPRSGDQPYNDITCIQHTHTRERGKGTDVRSGLLSGVSGGVNFGVELGVKLGVN